MKTKVILVIVILCAFLLGVGISVYALTSGTGGKVSLVMGENKFELQINDVNFEQLFKDEQYKNQAKTEAIKEFELYELDDRLISHISEIKNDTSFSRSLRDMRDRFIGPFYSPDKEVLLVFNDNITINHAEVCPDSDFYKNRLNIASNDFRKMTIIENADIMKIHNCHPINKTPINKEEITVNSQIKRDLFGENASITSVNAIAKVLPSYIILERR